MDELEPSTLNRDKDEGAFHMNKTWAPCETDTCLKVRQRIDSDQPCHCNMNPDPSFCLCSTPREQLTKHSSPCQRELKAVYSQLPVGSLVMVKAGRWPWWPAILSPDPNSGEYLKPDQDGHIEKYHVEFLGSPHTRFWARVKDVELYHVWQYKSRTIKGSLKKSYMVAMEEAVRLKDVGCEVRLQMCHFRLMNMQKSQWVKMEDTFIIGGFVFKSWTCLEDMVVGTSGPNRKESDTEL